jgi:uncharacterized membrane protein
MESNNNNQTPKTQTKITPYLVPLIILGVSLAAAAIAFPFLPDQIPLHFNISGEVTRYGSKYTIFLIALIPVLIYYGIKRKYGNR